MSEPREEVKAVALLLALLLGLLALLFGRDD